VRIRRVDGDGSRRFSLVSPIRQSLRVNQIQPLSDWGSSGGKRRRSAQAAGSRAPSAEAVVPVDPLHRDVLNGTQGAGQKWAAPADGFGFEQPDRRLGRALAYASPIQPIDAATSSSTTVSAKRD
jgi:hypothetical protein